MGQVEKIDEMEELVAAENDVRSIYCIDPQKSFLLLLLFDKKNRV